MIGCAGPQSAGGQSVHPFKNLFGRWLGATATPCYRRELRIFRRWFALQERQLRKPETASSACEGNAQPRPMKQQDSSYEYRLISRAVMEPFRKKTCKRKHIEITVDHDSDNDDAVNGVQKNKKVSIDPSQTVSNSVVNSIYVPQNTLNSDPPTRSHTRSMSPPQNVQPSTVHPLNLAGFENSEYLDKLLNDLNYNAYILLSIRALIDELSPDRPPHK
ncbi:UNVERIFIED_CONTAM: hypothetical protein FKN15_027856 [Acipenser sinensis]